MLQTQMFPRLPVRATFVADTNFVSETQKNVSDFCQKHFVSATNVFPFARHGHKTNVLPTVARLPTQETS